MPRGDLGQRDLDPQANQQVQDAQYPVLITATLRGKFLSSEDDIELDRGTVLSRMWDIRDGEYIYYPLTNWSLFESETSNTIEISSSATDTIFTGYLDRFFIDPTRTLFGVDTSGSGAVDDITTISGQHLIVHPLTGKYRYTIPEANATGNPIGAAYYHGDQNGRSNPTGILAEDVEIESTEDVTDVKIYVHGSFNRRGLIFPTDVDDNDIAGFLAVMEFNGLIIVG